MENSPSDLNGLSGLPIPGNRPWILLIRRAQYIKMRFPIHQIIQDPRMAVVYYKIWSAGYSILFSGNRYTLGENDPTNCCRAGMSRIFSYPASSFHIFSHDH